MGMVIPKKGDIVWIDFDPQAGREIQKRRPALVISPYSYNAKMGLALFLPMTSQIKKYPFVVKIQVNSTDGVILCDQVHSLDWRARNVKLIDQAPDDVVEEALAKLKVLL